MEENKSIDDLVFEAIRREIVEIFPEEVKGKSKKEIDEMANYIAVDFYDFVKDGINYYFTDK